MAHTPGPWTNRSKLDALTIVHATQGVDPTTEARYMTIARAACYAPDQPLWRGIDRETAEHNARIIAAAPDLLAACQQALEPLREYFDIDPNDSVQRAIETIGAAIRKATQP